MARFVGIDVAQQELVVAERPERGIAAFGNDASGHAALVAVLGSGEAPALIVLEGTGGLERAAAAALQAAGFAVAVANPRQVRAFARGVGRLTKTDAVDAAVLARFAEQVRPAPRPLPSAAARELAALVARRRQVRDARVAEEHRLARAATAAARASLGRMIAALAAELATLEAAIGALIAGDPALAATAELRQSVPSIGPVTGATLVAELPELGTLDAGEIGALGGVAPHTAQSGSARPTATVAGGRPAVRTALYLAAVTASRHNPVIKAFYDRLIARGKPAKVALIACAHKLLTLLNAMVRDGTVWDPGTAAP